MPRGAFPQPVYHDTVTMPLPGVPEGMRVVMTPTGPLQSLIGFFTAKPDCGASYQRKAASAVGLLFDFWVATAADPGPPPLFLHRFVKTLRSGTKDLSTGHDPLDLYWPPVSIKRLREIIRVVTAYGDYCALHENVGTLNPTREATFAERVARYRQLDHVNKHSLLKHLGTRKDRWEQASAVRSVRAPRDVKKAVRAPKHFPLDRTQDLLWTGFRVRQTGAFWEQYKVRDLMIAILQRFGGLRASEPFHMFVNDVTPVVRDVDDPILGTEAEVHLYHPSEGRIRYRDPITRNVMVSTRAAYLHTMWNRRPRDLMYHHGEYAGWKDLMLEDGPENRANVYWFPRVWGAVFWHLYDIYLRMVRPRAGEHEFGHPYLFVNQSDLANPTFGAPYRVESYVEQFDKAVRRIGLVPAKQFGTTTHGLRHAYGQVLSRLKMDRKSLQIFMHHKSPESQDAYTQPDLDTARAHLDAASRAIASMDGLREFGDVPRDLLTGARA